MILRANLSIVVAEVAGHGASADNIGDSTLTIIWAPILKIIGSLVDDGFGRGIMDGPTLTRLLLI